MAAKENRMNHTGDDNLLFATEHGWVRHCACRDLLVLHYREHWMVLSRPLYREFHLRLIELVQSTACPLVPAHAALAARFTFEGSDGRAAFTLDREGMRDLLWLLDSARFMLEARDAAAAGLRRAANKPA
jgi:hypothetical protein